jgi:hypothetical protein
VPENQFEGQMIVPVALQTLIEKQSNTTPEAARNLCKFAVKLDERFLTVDNEVRENRKRARRTKPDCKNLGDALCFFDRPTPLKSSNRTNLSRQTAFDRNK